eukprot:TRINITY_DN1898_c0_g1_i1.p1 TRINITY_DN1898_c0_g1~~TRINITY_DN1898_c0_g1_i1.p1  ORF type:complete len:2231 (+),score=540.36 TRINITY_DN1898_c0_g1_i1:707-6694(+)
MKATVDLIINEGIFLLPLSLSGVATPALRKKQPRAEDDVFIRQPIHRRPEPKPLIEELMALKDEDGPDRQLLKGVNRHPEPKQPIEEVTTLKEEDEPAPPLALSEVIGECKCAFVEKKIEFGSIAVGLSRDKMVTLKNAGPNDAFWQAEPPLPGLTLNPMTGRVPAGASQQIQVSLKPLMPQSYDTNIVFNVRGSKTLKMNVKADAEIPQVEVTQEEFDFKGVYVGGVAREMGTLVNQGTITAVMYLDLTNHPDFSITLPAPSDDADCEDDGSRVYCITLVGGKTLPFEFIFTPSAIESHAFEFPLTLAGLPSTPGLRRAVAGEGLRPPLLFSERVLAYGEQVVLKERSRRPPYPKAITVQNDDMETITWRLDASAENIQNGIFRVEPKEGSLEPGQSAEIRVIFTPRDSVVYTARIPSYINGADQVYMELEISGTGIYPMLTFDKREVMLPIVPIGTRTSATFYVINNGYETMQIRYKTPPDSTRIPLELKMLDGEVLSVTRPKLGVETSFVSSKPMSFTAKVDFLDTDGNKFSIPVTGMTDNCLFSLYPYIMANFSKLEWKQPRGKGISIGLKESDTADTMLALLGDTVSANKAASFEMFNDQSVQMITRWFNANVARTPVNAIPHDFIESDGKLLIDAIAFMSGKAVITKSKITAGSRQEKAQALLAQYEEMLTFLKSHGALVNNVKPENLLRAQKRSTERNFASLSTDAWLTTLLQAVRVFMLSRVTLKSLAVLPGVDPSAAASDPTLSTSNVYSIAEGVLLKWLAYHYNKYRSDTGAGGEPIKLTRFDTDLRDGHVLAALLISHAPSLASTLDKLKSVNDRTEKEDVTFNATKVIAAMREIGLDYIPVYEDFVKPNMRDMVLLCLSLYQTLPMYIPKATIEFSGRLGDKVTKSIELSNPSKRDITYKVTLEGSTEFSVASDTVVLPARGAATYAVEFTSRFSRPVSARLTLLPKRDANSNGAVIVFNLQSSQIAMRPAQVVQMETRTFEPAVLTLDVKNPFPAQCTFIMTLTQPKQIPDLPATITVPTDAFMCTLDTITMDANAVVQLPIQFLPLSVGSHNCQLLFSDKDYGEFVIDLRGTSTPPAVTDKFTIQSPAKQSATKEIALPFKNAQLDKARNLMFDRLGRKKIPPKLRESFLKFFDINQPVKFSVEYSSPFFTGPKEITLAPPGYKQRKPVGSDEEAETFRNALVVAFSPKVPGQYPGKITVKGPNGDIRFFVIDGIANVGATQAALEFKSPARTMVTQDIPVVNTTSAPWVIRAQLKGQYFTGPPQLTVPAGQTGYFPLVFKPSWVCDVKGELILNNTSTSDKYIYQLAGVGDEPVAEDKILMTGQARTKVQQNITVPNILGNQRCDYTIESDLPAVTGQPTLVVNANQKAEYTLCVTPQRGGLTLGTLKFATASGQYLWYLVQIDASAPAEEGVIEASSQLRRAVVINIELANPTNEMIEFDVAIDAEGVMGEPMLELAPNGSACYELLYSPLREGRFEGRVVFYNELVGEFWYKLKLQGEHADPEVVPEMSCPVGQRISKCITVDNPLNEEVSLRVTCNNPINFTVSPSPVQLTPFGSADVVIEYTPSSLDETENAVITLSNAKTGEWVFHASGYGTVPDRMPQVTTSAMMNQPVTSVVAFRNPFAQAVAVNVSLESETNAFQLMKRMNSVTVQKFAVLQIPLGFTPTLMQDFHCTVVVATDGGLAWRFPVKGVAETPANRTIRLRCRARNKVEETLELVLPGLGQHDPDELFTYELKYPREHETMLTRALTVTALNNRVTSPDMPLRFNVVFAPLRPVEDSVEFIVYKESGGRWLFELELVATDPEVDQIITIESELNQTSSVQFQLTNQFASFAPFRAHFDADSDIEFSVSPSGGVLEPYGQTGVVFIVSFRPSRYGKQAVGRLVIETEEMQWTYEVRGTHPKYQKPQVSSKVSTRRAPGAGSAIPPSTAEGGVRKNFLLYNMGRAKAGPVSQTSSRATTAASGLTRKTTATPGSRYI